MPVMRSWARAVAVALGLIGAHSAAAQESGAGDSATPEDSQRRTSGTVTFTSFVHHESAGPGTPLVDGAAAPDGAGLLRRFTDVRGRAEVTGLFGGRWSVRVDTRARRVGGGTDSSADNTDRGYDRVGVQSGTFGNDEYELRELFARRRGRRTDLTIGRQVVSEVAALKVDGLRFDHRANPHWRYLGFVGAHPRRGSRSVRDDYPVAVAQAGAAQERVVPVIAGLAGGYRYRGLYGSLGLAAVVPRGDQWATGEPEPNRLLVSGQGYWRRSPRLDLYHFVVYDLSGAGGRGFSQLTLGADYHPRADFRLDAQVLHVDTETLAVTAQSELEERDTSGGDRVQNNLELLRIASQTVRLGATAALAGGRYELSVHGALRRRPKVEVTTSAGQPYTFGASQAAEISVAATDRRSWLGFRLGLQLSEIFGYGGEVNLVRSTSRVVRLSGRRPLGGGATELELEATYLASEDDGIGTLCDGVEPVSCYGTSSLTATSAGALVFHRFDRRWYVVGSLHAGRQSLQVDDLAGRRIAQPSTVATTAFARVGYRF